MKRGEAERLELQSDILGGRGTGDIPDETEEINGPHIVIADGLPEEFRGQGLTVVHGALAGIVTQNAVDHDLLLALVEPAVFAA